MIVDSKGMIAFKEHPEYLPNIQKAIDTLFDGGVLTG